MPNELARILAIRSVRGVETQHQTTGLNGLNVPPAWVDKEPLRALVFWKLLQPAVPNKVLLQAGCQNIEADRVLGPVPGNGGPDNAHG